MNITIRLSQELFQPKELPRLMSHPAVNLPQLSLPTFRGDPRQWRQFWSSFNAAVHSQAIPEIQKLNYLYSCLKGNALQVVRGYDIAPENYEIIRQLLKNKYGESSTITKLLYNEIQSIKKSEREWIVEAMERVQRQLEALGEACNTLELSHRLELTETEERNLKLAPLGLKKSRSCRTALTQLSVQTTGKKSQHCTPINNTEDMIFDGPWKDSKHELSNNYGLCLITRLQHKSILRLYHEKIKDQLRSGIIEEVHPKDEIGVIHYLPHHESLNEVLYRGPIILPELVGVLLRYRSMKVVINADIEKAFLQIGLQESDRNSTRFHWLKDINGDVSEENINCYRLFIQNLWRQEISWDQLLNMVDTKKWKKLMTHWSTDVIELPRQGINLDYHTEIHIFVDASTVAYAAAVYARTVFSKDVTTTQLIFAKSRIAPIKKLYKIAFVQNRGEEIRKAKFAFRYIPSEQNPVDIASKGLSPSKLRNSNQWWKGRQCKWIKLLRTNAWALRFIKLRELPWLRSLSIKGNYMTKKDYDIEEWLLMRQSQSEGITKEEINKWSLYQDEISKRREDV
ncbi:unnamed protein product [Onchocerca ochengi]|uniref:Integrase catalytic domain-containing protein n=1 Tax=Onchocerca ochengi TaxID=42157 RepID=A0A182ENI7_ONCOC|nr:unnamed protein product [Onchocerca ochengi]